MEGLAWSERQLGPGAWCPPPACPPPTVYLPTCHHQPAHRPPAYRPRRWRGSWLGLTPHSPVRTRGAASGAGNCMSLLPSHGRRARWLLSRQVSIYSLQGCGPREWGAGRGSQEEYPGSSVLPARSAGAAPTVHSPPRSAGPTDIWVWEGAGRKVKAPPECPSLTSPSTVDKLEANSPSVGPCPNLPAF